MRRRRWRGRVLCNLSWETRRGRNKGGETAASRARLYFRSTGFFRVSAASSPQPPASLRTACAPPSHLVLASVPACASEIPGQMVERSAAPSSPGRTWEGAALPGGRGSDSVSGADSIPSHSIPVCSGLSGGAGTIKEPQPVSATDCSLSHMPLRCRR